MHCLSNPIRRVSSCLLALLLLSSAEASAQTGEPIEAIGQLANGLHYAVRAVRSEPGKALVHFIVRAGSAHDPAGASSTAHVVEHLVASSGENTPWGPPSEQIKRWNGTPGFHYNASTFEGYTSYFIAVDQSVPSGLDNALKFFQAGSQGLGFSDAAIVREIAAVREETRQNDNAAGRATGRNAGLIYSDDPRFAVTVDMNIAGLLALTPLHVRRFYNQWYRPDLEAVVVVGDIDVAEVERRIRTIFVGGTPGETGFVRDIKPVAVPNGAEQRVFTDPSISNTELMLAFVARKERWEGQSSGENELIVHMIGARLLKLTEAYSAPIKAIAVMPIANVDAGIEAVRIDTVLRPGRESQATESIVGVFQSVTKSGFSAEEIAAGKVDMLRSLSSDDLATTFSLYLGSFRSTGAFSALPSDDARRTAIEAMTLDDLNSRARALFRPTSSRWGFHVSDNTHEIPKLSMIDRWWRTTPSENSHDRRASAWAPPTLQNAVPVSAVRSEDYGLVRLEFPDRALTFVLRQTPQADVEILALTRSRLGDLDAEGLQAASVSAEVAQNSGLGSADKFVFAEMLKAKAGDFQRFVEPDFAGVRARADAGKLDDALALLPLAFQRAEISPAAWQDWREGKASEIATDPDGHVFGALVANARGLIPPLSGSELDRLTRSAVETAYDRIFASGEHRVIILSGTLPDNVEESVGRLAGRFPIAAEALRETSAPPAKPPLSSKVIASPNIVAATVVVMLVGAGENSQAEQLAANVTSALLRPRMLTRLRDAEKGAYNVLTNVNVDRLGRLVASVEFQCDPANIDRLVAAVGDEVGRMARDPELDREAEKVKPYVRDPDPAKWSSFDIAASILRDPPIFVPDRPVNVAGGDVRRIAAKLSASAPISLIRRPGISSGSSKPAD